MRSTGATQLFWRRRRWGCAWDLHAHEWLEVPENASRLQGRHTQRLCSATTVLTFARAGPDHRDLLPDACLRSSCTVTSAEPLRHPLQACRSCPSQTLCGSGWYAKCRVVICVVPAGKGRGHQRSGGHVCHSLHAGSGHTCPKSRWGGSPLFLSSRIMQITTLNYKLHRAPRSCVPAGQVSGTSLHILSPAAAPYLRAALSYPGGVCWAQIAVEQLSAASLGHAYQLSLQSCTGLGPDLAMHTSYAACVRHLVLQRPARTICLQCCHHCPVHLSAPPLGFHS